MFCLCSSWPSIHQRRPPSPPPRMWAWTKTTPRVEQARQGGVPGRVVEGVLVGAVAVEQGGGGAVERGVPVPHQRRRHLRSRPARGRCGVSADVAVRVVCRAPSCRCRSVRSAGAEVDVRPDRGAARTTRRQTVTAVAAKSLVVRLDRRCRPRRAGRPRSRGSASASSGSTRSRCRTSRAEAEHGVASRRRPPVPAARPGPPVATGSHARWSWSASRGTGHRASRNSWASSLVTSSSMSVPSGQHGVLGVVLHARAPPADRTRRVQRVGARRAPTPRVVSRLSDQITTRPPLRVARTFSSNRSSGSSSTSTSSAYDVPTACRHTWNGR